MRFAVMMALGAGLLAGCGGSSDDANTTTAAPVAEPTEESLIEVAEQWANAFGSEAACEFMQSSEACAVYTDGNPTPFVASFNDSTIDCAQVEGDGGIVKFSNDEAVRFVFQSEWLADNLGGAVGRSFACGGT